MQHWEPKREKLVIAAHVIPFALWIAVILVLQIAEHFTLLPQQIYPCSYIGKAIVVAALFIWLRPWQYYQPMMLRHVPLSLLVGGVVCVVWIMPEHGCVNQLFPKLQLFYYKWLVTPLGDLPAYYSPELYPLPPPGHPARLYMPDTLGWSFTLLHLAGSAFVIAVVEEFFFRGFLYRWLRNSRFWQLPLSHLDKQAFLITTILFAVEHDRWFAGLLAGLAYGWLAIYHNNIWSAVIAHITTNLFLGLYVIIYSQYGFW